MIDLAIYRIVIVVIPCSIYLVKKVGSISYFFKTLSFVHVKCVDMNGDGT